MSLSNEEKLKMFDTIQKTMHDYDLSMDNQEDADNFWSILRYGQEVRELAQDRLFIDILNKHKVEIPKEVYEDYRKATAKMQRLRDKGIVGWFNLSLKFLLQEDKADDE